MVLRRSRVPFLLNISAAAEIFMAHNKELPKPSRRREGDLDSHTSRGRVSHYHASESRTEFCSADKIQEEDELGLKGFLLGEDRRWCSDSIPTTDSLVQLPFLNN